MFTQTKSLPGKLLDQENTQLLDDVTVNIEYQPPANNAERAKVRAILTMKGVRPEFSDKTYILKLGEFMGRVFITTSSRGFSANQTWFKIIFLDAFWINREWLKYLKDSFKNPS